MVGGRGAGSRAGVVDKGGCHYGVEVARVRIVDDVVELKDELLLGLPEGQERRDFFPGRPDDTGGSLWFGGGGAPDFIVAEPDESEAVEL